jgi:hypothetical protein
MRLRCLGLNILLALLAAPFVRGQTTRPTGGDIEQLVAQLSSENWQERQAAQERLVLLGLEAKDRLARLLKETADPELRSLAETALAQIEQNRLTGASIITIRDGQITLKELFSQISEQCGATLEPAPPNLFEQNRNATFAIDIDHEPFWSAMKQVTAKTGLSLNLRGGPGREVRIIGGQPPAQWPSVVSGPYQVTATRVSRTRTIDLGGNIDAQAQFVVQMTVTAEPKLRVVRAAGAAKLDAAVDENGASLVPGAGANAQFGYYSSIGNTWQVSVPLADAPNIGRRIATLRGSVDAAICTDVERLEIADILEARNLTRAIGDVRLTVLEISKKGEQYELRLRLEMTPATASDWSQIPMQEIMLVDADGTPLSRRGYSANGRNHTYDATILFARDRANPDKPAGEPAKLVWDFPTRTKPVSIPFEFKDLPIP